MTKKNFLVLLLMPWSIKACKDEKLTSDYGTGSNIFTLEITQNSSKKTEGYCSKAPSEQLLPNLKDGFLDCEKIKSSMNDESNKISEQYLENTDCCSFETKTCSDTDLDNCSSASKSVGEKSLDESPKKTNSCELNVKPSTNNPYKCHKIVFSQHIEPVGSPSTFEKMVMKSVEHN